MILQYGTYVHNNNEVAIAIASEPLRSKSDLLYGFRQRWTLTGFPGVESDSSIDLTQVIENLEAAYAVDGQDLVLYQSDGVTPTAHALYSAQTLGGTRVTTASFPKSEGGEYTTYRSYSVGVEAEIPLRSDNIILAYQESMKFVGDGGPLIVYVPVAQGAWVRQQTSSTTLYRMTQAGRAVGLYSYPSPNPPAFPTFLRNDLVEVSNDAPRLRRNQYYEFTTAWSYTFESNIPLVATPYLQPIQ